MEDWIITSRQTFKEKLDNPHQRFKFHSSLIFGFTGVSIPYFEPIFPTFIYLSTLLERAQLDLEYLRSLPQTLRQLGVHENFLPEAQRISNEIRESQRWFEQSFNELQTNQQRIKENLEAFNQEIVAVRDLENYLRNFQRYS